MLNITHNLKKSIIPGIILGMTGMILQVGKNFLLLKGQPPKIDFVVGAAICYIMLGFFFCFGFFVFNKVIPGKHRFEKAFRYTLFAYICVGFPGLLGVIAFDFAGGTNLLSDVKIDDYAILVTDFINLVIVGGILLGFSIDKDIEIYEPYNISNRLVISSVLCSLFFPIISFSMHILINYVSPFDYQIPNQMVIFHYVTFYGILILTGVLMPAFYQIAARLLAKFTMTIPVTFTFFFFICLWLMNIAFLIPFGFSWSTTVKFWIENLLSILLTSVLISKTLNRETISMLKMKLQ